MTLKWKIWKTISLEKTEMDTFAEFQELIKSKGMQIGHWLNSIKGYVLYPVDWDENKSDRIEIDLVLASLSDLGCQSGQKLKDIYCSAEESGLRLIAPEIGFRISAKLRLLYTDQPKGEFLVICTPPMAFSKDCLGLCLIGHDNGPLWIDCGCGGCNNFCNNHTFDCFWLDTALFIFELPRKS